MTKQWRAVPREELECSGQRIIEDEKGDEVAYVGFDEDAELIVLACNAHAGLVQGAKVALAMVHGMELAGADKAACEAVAEALENALRVAGINVKERSGMSLSEILDLGITS